MAKIKIISKEGEEPLPLEILEQEIVKLANVGKRLEKSRLKQKTIILLLHDITKIPKRYVEYVLNALPQLESIYLKGKKE